MVLMRPRRCAREPSLKGGARLAALNRANSPARIISSPVRQLDFFYFDYVDYVGMNRAGE
jgi:hypothetical protein